MVSLSNHVATPLKQWRRLQRRDRQLPHRVRGHNDKFCDFLISDTRPISLLGARPDQLGQRTRASSARENE